ncbi:MAG: VanW family protein [Peptococcaceae bacterium BRH_c4b]|nr:MAG: VanW family protein [Peptococcaceae bacterium BRH_c4b]
MKKIPLLAIAILISSLLLLTPSFSQNQTHPQETTSDDYKIYRDFKDMEKPYQGPLPWEKDTVFLEAVKKNNTPVLMAAYKATLHDPILSEAYNISLAAEHLAGTMVKPGEIFSQNNTIGPYARHRGYRDGPTYAGNHLVTTVGGGVCKIATMLYNVVTFSDMQIVMRSSHSMIVPYVPPGQDATVYYGVRDFRFLNDTGTPVLIWSRKVGNSLFMALYGSKKPPRVTWHHKVIKRAVFWTEYRFNPSLQPGTEKEVMPGMDGYIVKSWVTVEKPGGTVLTKDKGTSYYNAFPRIMERGPQKR